VEKRILEFLSYAAGFALVAAIIWYLYQKQQQNAEVAQAATDAEVNSQLSAYDISGADLSGDNYVDYASGIGENAGDTGVGVSTTADSGNDVSANGGGLPSPSSPATDGSGSIIQSLTTLPTLPIGNTPSGLIEAETGETPAATPTASTTTAAASGDIAPSAGAKGATSGGRATPNL
jgi:hypothetical protein